MFYLRLAINNLKKNRTAFIPFCIATVFTVVLNIIIQVMLYNKGMNTLPQAASVKTMFQFGKVVIIIFSVIFTFYTHSFLTKRRKKEISLYNILGMNKRNLTFMLWIETLLTLVIVLIAGFLSGVVFSKLMFLLLKRLTGFGDDFVYQLSFGSFVEVILLFVGIFVLTFIYDAWQVGKSKPIELLSQSKSGEKEPKAKWISALIGVGCLSAGYYISLTISSPVAAIAQFFFAVVLVIIGTYGLFIAGSVTLLKMLKKNKKFYYKPSNFISISSMIFRMKQNGAGLATICILCTMALVTISTTICLYIGQEDAVRFRNPLENQIMTSLPLDKTKEIVYQTADKKAVKIQDFNYLEVSPTIIAFPSTEDKFERFDNKTGNYEKIVGLTLISLSEYNRVTNKSETLAENDVLVYPVTGKYSSKTLAIASQTFNVKKVLKEFSAFPKKEEDSFNECLVILSDEAMAGKTYQQIKKDFDETLFAKSNQLNTMVYFKMTGKSEDRLAAAKQLEQEFLNKSYELQEEADYSSSFIDEDREFSKNTLGGFLFIGLIFGISFILATTLIIFYKQISEGNNDRERFVIMQKVGLSHKEVKKTIHRQIIMVFFLPITVAVLHLAFAFPIIRKLLVLFGLTNTSLLITVTVACVAVFALFYFLIYWQTSKVYYRLVERN